MEQHSPSDLGQIAYLAYSEATSGVTHDGRPMPAWEDLGDTIQGAWIAAAAAVADHTAGDLAAAQARREAGITTAEAAPAVAEQEDAR
ncbi:hypothetical protein JK361_25865 [Streptomyces sp. 5-8]|uniref:Uncharacterized protein n=1 Tax=Streptomyces musisoli TaxID=2802280 RepID=A0ABS1P6H8_9ACTN|nr:hypothetical protein [Streptomyces musisoli]MBL1107974.1 hypothetical protein [Streptomyces musisoli]